MSSPSVDGTVVQAGSRSRLVLPGAAAIAATGGAIAGATEWLAFANPPGSTPPQGIPLLAGRRRFPGRTHPDRRAGGRRVPAVDAPARQPGRLAGRRQPPRLRFPSSRLDIQRSLCVRPRSARVADLADECALDDRLVYEFSTVVHCVATRLP